MRGIPLVFAEAVTDAIEVQLLREVDHGGTPDQPAQVAAALAAFAADATSTLDVAIYDFRLSDENLVSTVVGAFTDAVKRGVTVRIGYDAGKPADADATTFALLEADPAPVGTAAWVTEHFAGTGVQTKALQASPYLMHSKFIVRDAAEGAHAVWTGSTNFTDDAWTLQENNILRITGAAIARGFAADFAQLWAAGAITATGTGDNAGATESLGWDFSPGDGAAIDAALTARIAAATTDIRIGAMVLTSHAMLTALVAALDRGVPISGVYDAGQMDPIVRQWKKSKNGAQTAADFGAVAEHLVPKHSTPYTPTSRHDFMHLKVLITDDVLSTGSYNFSANAQHNAENQIHTTRTDLVSTYRTFIDDIAAAYR